jgi:hypothetical protein
MQNTNQRLSIMHLLIKQRLDIGHFLIKQRLDIGHLLITFKITKYMGYIDNNVYRAIFEQFATTTWR